MRQGEKEITIYECRILTMWEGPPLANSNFGATSKTAMRCAVAHCHGGKPHYRREDWDNSRAHKERVTPRNSKRGQFAKWVSVLNYYSRPSAHVPRVT